MALAAAAVSGLLNHPAARLGVGVAGVGGSASTGYEAAGAIGGVIAALVAVIGLALSISAGKNKARRDYEHDMDDARKEGRKERNAEVSAQASMIASQASEIAYWRGLALSMISGGAQHPAMPPLGHTEPHRDEEVAPE